MPQPAPTTVATSVVPRPTPTSIGVDSSVLAAVLTAGSTGPDVVRLQQRLSDLGFALGPIDGVYGTATEQALWAFKKLVGGMSYQDLVDDPHASEVSDEWWEQINEPVTIEPRRPAGGATHVEVYLPSQVLVVFVDDRPALIAHVSSGELDDLGQPAQWCETVTFDTDNAGQPLPHPITRSGCAASKTPGGVFKASRVFEGTEITEVGGMYNPVFFNYGIAIHGADNVPLEPVSHGAIRITGVLPTPFAVSFTLATRCTSGATTAKTPRPTLGKSLCPASSAQTPPQPRLDSSAPDGDS